MKQNSLNKGRLTDNATGIGPVTRDLVQARTRELAEIAGRTSLQVTQADYERAKRELTGESDMDRQEAILDALPEIARWNPVPGSRGHQAAESPTEDEDAEGRSETEQLVDEGAIEAARDRQLQAARMNRAADGSKPSVTPAP
jgi:hypothetical protein